MINESFTTFEQASKLAVFLDPNTADMAYYSVPQNITDPTNGYSCGGVQLICYPDFNEYKRQMSSVYSGYRGPVPTYFNPCWSLARLLDLVPTKIDRVTNNQLIGIWELQTVKCDDGYEVYYLDNRDPDKIRRAYSKRETLVKACTDLLIYLEDIGLLPDAILKQNYDETI